ncbi:hypothetical protein HGRIS_013384 [Hohenbuehelia grisea]|uniref:Galactose-1-phosphate uridylyltransferase n=1 Tax=Hohenbuehelia grisea TaxID=104357 RepID=A0ABR3IVI7_9AGAR
MTDFDPSTHPHRRFNPLLEEHVLVSPHRMKRPWLGQVEAPQTTTLPQYDEKCYLCPGNSRSSGVANDPYEHTYVFENDFAAVLPAPAPAAPVAPHRLLSTEPVHGGCDVLIFHPRHDLTLPQLPHSEVLRVVQEWINLYLTRGRQEGTKYVQIFENKGSIMGCSNPHPHCQTWTLSAIPTIPSKELASLRRYSGGEPSVDGAPSGPKGRPCLLCEYAHLELSQESERRIVAKNDHWLALVPWWATWPFELLVLPYRRHISSIADLTGDEKDSFARILTTVTVKYDNLFQCSFAYSMGIHQRPIPPPENSTVLPDNDEDNIAHLHLHFAPPLLRSASVRKFLVGFELMAEAQRDLTPEQAAARLRACSENHYLDSTRSTA